MMMRELKPCPLCGRKVRCYSASVQDGRTTDLEVWCEDCLATFTITTRFIADAVDTWNRRADNG